MTNSFPSVPETTLIRDSLQALLTRDKAALSCYSGENDPPATSLTPDMVGMPFVNTSTKEVKQLTQLINGVATWTTILNFSSPIPNQEDIEAGYQPLSPALTQLSDLVPTPNAIPYFTEDAAASIPTTLWARNFVASPTNAEARTALGVGEIGTKDIIGNSDIEDGAITLEKINPNVDIASAGYDLGDVMQTTGLKTLEDGWCPLCFADETNPTFGAPGCGATVVDDSLKALYQMFFPNQNFALYTQDGQSASKTMTWEEAWYGLYRLQLPQINGRSLICGDATNIGKTGQYTIYAGNGDSSFSFVSVNAYVRTK